MKKPQTDLQSFLVTQKGALKKYRLLTCPNTGLFKFLIYETSTYFLAPIPGALGLYLRSKLYRLFFKQLGKNVVFGRNVVIRNPGRIVIGNNVLIDDNCTLDARGTEGEGIKIENGVIIGKNTIISMKNGTINIGNNTNIGVNCTLQTSTSLILGENIIIAAYTYIVAGGNHRFDRTDIPMISQGMNTKGGIEIKDNCWLGARSTIMDGVIIEKETIIGACALVNKNIPEYSIAVGVPAKVFKNRK